MLITKINNTIFREIILNNKEKIINFMIEEDPFYSGYKLYSNYEIKDKNDFNNFLYMKWVKDRTSYKDKKKEEIGKLLIKEYFERKKKKINENEEVIIYDAFNTDCVYYKDIEVDKKEFINFLAYRYILTRICKVKDYYDFYLRTDNKELAEIHYRLFIQEKENLDLFLSEYSFKDLDSLLRFKFSYCFKKENEEEKMKMNEFYDNEMINDFDEEVYDIEDDEEVFNERISDKDVPEDDEVFKAEEEIDIDVNEYIYLRNFVRNHINVFPALKNIVDVRLLFADNIISKEHYKQLIKAKEYIDNNKRYLLTKSFLKEKYKNVKNKEDESKYFRYFAFVSGFESNSKMFYFYRAVENHKSFYLNKSDEVYGMINNLFPTNYNVLTYGVNVFKIDLRKIRKNFNDFPKNHYKNKGSITSLLNSCESFQPIIRFDIDTKIKSKENALKLIEKIKESNLPISDIVISGNNGIHLYTYVDFFISISNKNRYYRNNRMYINTVLGMLYMLEKIVEEFNKEHNTDFKVDTRLLNFSQGMFYEERAIAIKNFVKSRYVVKRNKKYSIDELKEIMIDIKDEKAGKYISYVKKLALLLGIKVKTKKIIDKKDFDLLLEETNTYVAKKRRYKIEEEYIKDICNAFKDFINIINNKVKVIDGEFNLTDEMKDTIVFYTRKGLIDVKTFKEYERIKYVKLGSYLSTAISSYILQDLYQKVLGISPEVAYDLSVSFIKHFYNKNRYTNKDKYNEIIERIENERYGMYDEERYEESESLKRKSEQILKSIISGRLYRTLDKFKKFNLLFNTFIQFIKKYIPELLSIIQSSKKEAEYILQVFAIVFSIPDVEEKVFDYFINLLSYRRSIMNGS